MSHYTRGTCNITDPEALVDALIELGLKPILSREGLPLVGYRNDARAERAHVILRREGLTTSSNDIGFFFGPNGCEDIISDYDRGIGYNQAWVDKVTMLSAVHATLRTARKQGHEAIRTNEGGKIKVRISTGRG